MARKSWLAVAGVVVALVSLALFISACGGSEEAPAETAAEATIVDVRLSEFKVSLSAGTAPAGTVTFRLMNDGAVVHNFRVIRTDLAADELPVDEAAFTVDEDQVDVLASGSDLDASAEEEITADLAAGSYVLICNIPTHYDAGMHTTFTVE